MAIGIVICLKFESLLKGSRARSESQVGHGAHRVIGFSWVQVRACSKSWLRRGAGLTRHG